MATSEKTLKPELKPEQALAINHERGNVIVSASAGSGKTFVMIERIIRLLKEKKARVTEILATTFTEASAQDMKRKLYTAISNLATETGDADFYSQLLEVQSASVCTIDSFSANLLREYFFKVGLSPDFRIADETDAGLLKDTAIKKTFREFYRNRSKEFLSFVDKTASGRNDLELRKLVSSIYEILSCEADREKLLNESLYNCSKIGFENIKAQMLNRFTAKSEKFLTEVERIKAQALLKNFQGLVKYCDKLIAVFNDCPHFNSVYQVLDDGLKIPSMSGGRAPADEEYPIIKNQLVSVRDSFKKELSAIKCSFVNEATDELRRAVVETDTKVLIDLVRSFSKNYDQLKREENVLDFGDLEWFVLELLKDQEALTALKGKYKYIFVDECQDLNAVQSEILNALTSDNAFMVGDVKQSIYGFRGSRPEIFEERFNGASARKETALNLNHNFRSAKNIIDAVNKVFSYAMTEKAYGVDYATTAMLVAGGVYPEGNDGRVNAIKLLKSPAQKTATAQGVYDILSSESLAQSEIKGVAKLINKIIAEERLSTYYDYKTKEHKRIGYGDILILARGKSTEYVKELLRGLNEFNIPVQSTSKDNVLNYLEIRVLCAVLELVNDINLDVPLATVLKSPIGNFTDDQLAVIALECDLRHATFSQKCGWYLENGEDKTIINKLKCFYEYFNELRFFADFMSASEVVEKVIADFSLEAYYSAGEKSDNAEERVRFFVSVLRKGLPPYSVPEAIRLIESNPNSFNKEFSAGGDAVSVMTMHASKGLEFPVVIVCGLQNSMNKKDETEKFLKDEKFGFAVSYYDETERKRYTTPLRELIKLKKGEDRVREELRLLYVALTRAKYSLYILTEESKEITRSAEFNGADKMIEYFPLDFKFTETNESELDFESKTQKTGKILVGEKNAEIFGEIVNNLEFKYPHAVDTELPLKSSVTEAVRGNQPATQKIENLYTDYENKTDNERGTIAHKFMELYDFTAKRTAKDQAELLIEKGLMQKDDLAKIDLTKIEVALKSAVFNGIENKRVFREKSFLANFTANELFANGSTEKVLVQGFIDLLIEENGGFRVVDYKYANKTAKQLLDTYSKQLKLYALAVERATGLKVKNKTILSLITGESVEVE